MTHHTPAAIPPPPLLAPLLGGLVMLVVAVAVVFGVARLTDRKEFDTDPFCWGVINGTFQGWSVAGADTNTAAVAAYSAPCERAAATRGLDPAASFCEGFVQAFLQVGALIGEEPPPEGALAYVETRGAECVAMGLWFEPVLPERPPLGGGGPPPSDN